MVCESRQFSILGQNIYWNDQIRDRYKSQQNRNFLQIHKKIKRHKQVSRLLQPDQRQKQKHSREKLLIHQLSYRCTKEDGLGETPESFTGRILFMSMFNDISCGTEDIEKECLAHARVVSLYARKFGTG